MGKKKDVVKENSTLIKNYINETIERNEDLAVFSGYSFYRPKVTLYLKRIQKIIRARKKFVLDMKTITNSYDRNKNFNMFPADKIRIIFYDNGMFYLGFDTEISDHRKRFQPLGESILEYELLEKLGDDFVSMKLSDICSTEKMFSYESLENLKLAISKILDEYPDFYDRLFSEKKGIQKTILN